MLFDLVKLKLGALAALTHLILLAKGLLPRGQPSGLRQLGRMHSIDHLLDLGRQRKSAFVERLRGDLEELCGLFALKKNTLVDELLVELLHLILI